MMKLRLLVRNLTWLCASILLAACGGDNQPDPDPPYQQQFNPYLPLAVGASLSYQDTNVGAIDSMHILNEELSQQTGNDIYEVTMDSGDRTFSFFFSSDANRIRLYGIDGPIAITSGNIAFELDELRFDNPITLQSSTSASGGTTLASAVISAGGSSSTLNNINVTYQTVNVDSVYNGQYGTLPVRAALLNAAVTANVSILGATYNIDETLSNSLLFAKGIGIVRHSGTYVSTDYTYNSELTGLNNLPRSVWFNYNNGNPQLASGSSSIFQINGQGTISSNDYRLANLDNINALGWIRVQEGSGRYTVSMPGGGSLPTSTTSVEAVFEHRVTGRRVSANVTLLVP